MLIQILAIFYTFLIIGGIISYTVCKGYGGISITFLGVIGLVGTVALGLIIELIKWIINLF